ncbi:MAG: O-antigen ligase family protein [Chloroflexia bacterium]
MAEGEEAKVEGAVEQPSSAAGGGGGRFGRGAGAVQEGLRELVERLGRQRLLAIGLVLVLIVSPWPPLTLAALAAYVVVAFKTPGVTTALIPLAFPFAYQPKSLFGPLFPVVELLLLVALATSGVQVLARWRRAASAGSGSAAVLDFWDEVKRILGGSFGLQAAALALIATFSLFTVADQAHLRESLREYRTVVIEPLLYFFLARHWLRGRELRLLAIGAFVGGATIVGLLAIGQVATGQGVVATEGVRRAIGTYRHPNALALYLVRAVAFAAAFVALAGAPRRVVALIACLPVIGLALVLTFSRGAFLGLIAALAVLLAFLIAHQVATRVETLRRKGSRAATAGGDGRTFGLAVAAIAVVAVVLVAAVVGLTLVRASSDSLSLRQLIWRSTLEMIRDRPAFGVGLDQFLSQYAPRYIDPSAWDERYTSHPHNLFLDFWVRLGIMGLAWVAWTLGSLAVRLMRAWRPAVVPPPKRAGRATGEAAGTSAANDELRPVLIAAGVACVAAVVHGMLDNFFFLIDLAFAWWFLIALVQIGAEGRGEEPTEGW